MPDEDADEAVQEIGGPTKDTDFEAMCKNLKEKLADAEKFNKELKQWVTDLSAANDALKNENLQFWQWFVTLRDISIAMQQSMINNPPKVPPADLLPPALNPLAPQAPAPPTAPPPLVIDYGRASSAPPALSQAPAALLPPLVPSEAPGEIKEPDPVTNQQRMDQVRRSVLKTFVALKENPNALMPSEVRARYQNTWSWIVSDKTLKMLCNEMRVLKGADALPL